MARLLIIEDELSLSTILKKLFQKKGYEVEAASDGELALRKLEQQDFDVVILDINLPSVSGLDLMQTIRKSKPKLSFIVMTAQDTMKNAVEAMKRGAFDYLTKPFDLEELETLVSKALKSKQASLEAVGLKNNLGNLDPETKIIGQSKPIKDIYKMIGRVSNNDVSVLIFGESGTGKELIAKSIHQNSSRTKGPFVAVNCAAIPKDLLESELFGYVKGAFTGAHEDRMGYFERANGGTVFLDEIGDMPLVLQAKLLRVLQEREIQRLGQEDPRPIDVRVVSATHQDLEKKVADKSFREDLYFRLNVIPIYVPPLRDRKEDISILANYFLKKLAQEHGGAYKKCTEGSLKLLENYRWPGNIRELENVLKRAAILSSNDTLDVADFAPFLGVDNRGNVYKDFEQMHLEELIENKIQKFLDRFEELDVEDLYQTIITMAERPLIKLVLNKLNGNQIRTAKVLGINRNTLRKKIRELQIIVKDNL